MAKKKDKNKQKQQTKQAKQYTLPKPNKSLLQDNEVLKKVFSSLFYFAGSVVAVYELINYFRSDTKIFTSLIIPGLIGVVWLVVLVQMFRRRNSYAYVLLGITIIGGVVGGIGWQSFNQAQEDKVVVLVAQFDGPEETYGLHDQIMEDLRQATKGYDDTEIIDGNDVVTSGQGSEYARELGKKVKADLVIWAWYRPTENPNITIHFENLSTSEIDIIQQSETYHPQTTLVDLESFTIQRKLGSQTSTLVSFISALSLYKADQYKSALERFEQILDQKDISTYIAPATLYFYIGNSYVYLEQYEQSIKYLSEAIMLDANVFEYYLSRGLAYSVIENYDFAIADYSKAIELTSGFPSDNARAYNNRGTVYEQAQQSQLAIQDYDQAIKIDPNFHPAYYNRGNIYLASEEYQSAIQDYNKATEIQPDFSWAYQNRGLAYEFLNQHQLAIKDFKKAINLDPQAETYNNLGGVYFTLGNYSLAISNYTEAIQIKPQEGFYSNRGNAYHRSEQYELALMDYDKAIQLNPQFAIAFRNRGVTYQKLGESDKAEADFKKYEELTGQELP